MFDLGKDVRLAARVLARRPGLTAAAVATLALGIGATSAIFSLVNAVLLRKPPAERPDQLVEIYTGEPGGFRYSGSSYPDLLDLRRETDAFAAVAAYNLAVVALDEGAGTRLLFGEEVSANYFDLLGLRPVVGRGFLPEEEASPGEHPVVVLSHGFWRQRFAGDPGVLGRTLRFSGLDFTVVGVAPEALRGSFPALAADYWIPISMHDALSETPDLPERRHRWHFIKARLRDGVTPEQARAQVATLSARLARAYPDSNEGRELVLVPASEVALNPGIDGPLFGVAGLLLAMVGMVLLIACSNLANLLLARASDRRREMAVRLAIGGSRGRLIRQLLVESLLLAGLGGALGLALATWLASALASFRPPLPIPLALDLAPDARVLAFTLGLALLAGVLCGLAPAREASRPELVSALKDDGTGFGRRFRRLGMRNLLVVGQVAVSTVLLLGAGLFARSLAHAQAIDPGFALRRGAVAQVALGLGNAYSEDEGRVFYRALVERVRALPGVRAAALADHLPLGFSVHTTHVGPEGREIANWDQAPQVDTTTVGSGYFATMGIALVAGRDFSAADGPSAPRVAIVNETAAKHFWPGQDPLGRRLRFDPEEPWHEVVAVAADGKYRTLGEPPRPFVYANLEQDYMPFMGLVVAAAGDEAELAARIKGEVEALDPNVPLFDLRTMTQHLALMLFPARMGAALLSAFGLLGLVLASVGLYGVVAYTVARRTREVGIRMAVGAGEGDVVRLVVGEGMALVGVGLALGVAAALAGTRVLGSLLYGISPSDPLTFATVPLLLAAVALAANLLPALRATRVAPLAALRSE